MGLALSLVAVPAADAPAATALADLARTGIATASSTQDDADGFFPAEAAIDGDEATRWASAFGPDEQAPSEQWLQVDLGSPAVIETVVLSWEAAHAEAYTVQVAAADPGDESSWTTVHDEVDGDGGTDEIALGSPADARFVRVLMTERAALDWDPARPHWYGYSLFGVEVHGTRVTDEPSDIDEVSVLEDFEAGVSSGYTAWGVTPAATPTLVTAQEGRDGAGEGNHALVAQVGGSPADGEWFGFTHEVPRADWSDHDGFTFWFLGAGDGQTLRYELKSAGQLFERRVVDDSVGWRQVSVAFADLRLKDDPSSDVRFDPAASTGFA